MNKLLSPQGLADMLGLSVQTIYNRQAKHGDLPPVIKIGRLTRFREADVERWINGVKFSVSTPSEPRINKKRRPGRPTKAEQIAARDAAIRISVREDLQ